MIGARGDFALLILLGKGWCFVDFTTDDIAGDNDEDAEQKWYPPAPAIERFGRHVGCKWQEDCRGKNLPSLHSLESKAGVETASPKWGML
jgi:hypothetical protein